MPCVAHQIAARWHCFNALHNALRIKMGWYWCNGRKLEAGLSRRQVRRRAQSHLLQDARANCQRGKIFPLNNVSLKKIRYDVTA